MVEGKLKAIIWILAVTISYLITIQAINIIKYGFQFSLIGTFIIDIFLIIIFLLFFNKEKKLEKTKSEKKIILVGIILNIIIFIQFIFYYLELFKKGASENLLRLMLYLDLPLILIILNIIIYILKKVLNKKVKI